MKISSKKQKPYSSWSGSGIATRDARHDKPSDEWSEKPAKKDKQWCKGKEGRAHHGEWLLSSLTECTKVCKRCYKVLEYERSGKMAKILRRRNENT